MENAVKTAPNQTIKKRKHALKIDKSLYLLLIPGMLITLVYAYGPMFGLVIAFQDFNIAKGIFGSEWVGLSNFKYLFTSYPTFGQVIKNTISISLLKMVFNFVAPIVVALLLNEVVNSKFKRSVQTLIYLPHFISWVTISGIIITMLHPDNGIINYLLIKTGIIDEGIYFLGENATFRFVLIITDVWKNFGYGTIIYMAALTGVDPELYEAATIDRANRWQKMRYITIPSLTPIIVLVLTLNMGGILNGGFDQIFNLYNPLVYETADILDTFVYRIGITDTQYDMSTAVSLVKSVVSCVLVSTTYFIAYKKANYRIF
ncbi:MAG: ABC transporter permease subunit [Oscillospiraceae bacterium]